MNIRFLAVPVLRNGLVRLPQRAFAVSGVVRDSESWPLAGVRCLTEELK